MSHPTTVTSENSPRTGVTATQDGVQMIGLDELRARIARDDDFVLVMAMDQRRFDTAHIEGSISFDTLLEELPNLDRGTEFVVYCTDAACVASRVRAAFLVNSGFPRVSRFAGGLAEWSQADLPLASVKRTG